MDDSGHHENGRHKPPQGPWLMQHHPSMKQIMAIMAERDAAIQERNLALSEKKIALAERDMATLQRDSAMADRNNAIKERDNAIAALHYRENSVNNNNAIIPHCPPECQIERGVKHIHHPQQSMNHFTHIVEQDHYNIGSRSTLHKGDMQINEAIPIPLASIAPEPAKSARRPKRPKEANPTSRRTTKPSKKVIKQDFEDNNKMTVVFKPSLDWKPGPGCSESWKEQDLGLNQVSFDETTMPVPVCSCTGSLRPCYKWGNGGWQSSCCTTNLSMYPLPAMPNKRHARVGGRKMSGSAFNKLISRLAAEGQDLSNPVDLKDNWAKHGTNRYITIK